MPSACWGFVFSCGHPWLSCACPPTDVTAALIAVAAAPNKNFRREYSADWFPEHVGPSVIVNFGLAIPIPFRDRHQLAEKQKGLPATEAVRS
jgi:hypothetical protein